MIAFEKFTLENRLKFIVHTDKSASIVAFNVLYDVGARDEDPNHTGFAHLFEHLMFGGSKHIATYDVPLQMAGGENNAYTTNDITNYYLQIPKDNLEVAFWLESDRMLELAFSPTSLEVQRKVVCEEFKEHYINKPYGDAWKHLRALAYQKHPYQWMTIGKELGHIEKATLDEVKDFFYTHYTPANAIICVAGNITVDEVMPLAKKWFEPIPSGKKALHQYEIEPEQKQERIKEIRGQVPYDGIWKAYHIPGRLKKGYYAADLISDILGGGLSSLLYTRLVKELQLFSTISAYQTGSIDPGLLVIEGKVIAGVAPQKANEAIEAVINDFLQNGLSDHELQKLKHKIEAMIVFEDTNLLSRANNLAFFELLGDAALMNEELGNYQNITKTDIILEGQKILSKSNCSTLYYLSDTIKNTTDIKNH